MRDSARTAKVGFEDGVVGKHPWRVSCIRRKLAQANPKARDINFQRLLPTWEVCAYVCVFYLARSFTIVLGGQVAGAVCRIMAWLFHTKQLLFQTLALGKRERETGSLECIKSEFTQMIRPAKRHLRSHLVAFALTKQAKMALNDPIRSLSMHCFSETDKYDYNFF